MKEEARKVRGGRVVGEERERRIERLTARKTGSGKDRS